MIYVPSNLWLLCLLVGLPSAITASVNVINPLFVYFKTEQLNLDFD
jgi:hypothetical protein